jgi:hypothetical protein
MAPMGGLEPPTLRLTGEHSTVELHRNVGLRFRYQRITQSMVRRAGIEPAQR